jgi:hypothetical protein
MPAATRAILRQSQFLTRRTVVRHASSTSEAASKAGQSASNAASKAQEGLSKATAAAGPALSNAASALRKVGGPVGKVVSFVDCKRLPGCLGSSNSPSWMERLWMVNAGGIGCSIATIEVLPGVLRSLLVDKSSLRNPF